MAGVSLEEFELRMRAVCSASPVVERILLFTSTETSKLWRLHLSDTSLADVYYSASAGKTSFAHVRDNKRVFGADNAGGWHPYEDPEAHIPSPTEITFEEFLKKLESHLK